jgi:RNA polymerase-binding transcription factor DksA
MADMDKKTVSHFKQKLQDELVRVEAELRSLGWKNEAGEWDATGGDIDTSATESDELGDRQEAYQENRAEIDEIQIHWKNIKRALEKIEEGTYGVCEISGEEIEEDRLEVNPSARTCTAHMDEEAALGA